MSWFKRKSKGITTQNQEKKEIPEGLWYQCPECKHVVTSEQHAEHDWVCEACEYHEKIGSLQYFSIFFDEHEWTEVAENMKTYGGFVPGIRSGKPTSQYLQYVLSRITAPGSVYLALVAIIPILALIVFGASQNFPFGGTAILIVVGVGLDTAKQIESQLQQRSYEGFLK